MREVYLIGQFGQTVRKRESASLREMGARALKGVLEDAGRDDFDALYLSNLLSDDLQKQKHLAPLIASEAGFIGKEAYDVRAATAAGAAALRTAILAVGSGEVETAIALGVEKMSEGQATEALSHVLDAEFESGRGENMLSANAALMRAYMERYQVAHEVFANFSLNAHQNSAVNPKALFRRVFSRERILKSPTVIEPLQIMDCAPICDGAAAVMVSAQPNPDRYRQRVRVLSSAVACDHMRVDQRPDPLALNASRWSAERAFARANLSPERIDFFEAHDAFTIMSCLALEACGFAKAGEGWRMAEDGEIFRDGQLPLSTCGGLKARGHPIGASALYQTGEIFRQLQGTAGDNQIERNRIGMMQSIGGAGTTIVTHIFGRDA
ncbi:MAG: thiolase domain-containing protein [bacterium]|nr:thiolase domain-containing protein [bacterium]